MAVDKVIRCTEGLVTGERLLPQATKSAASKNARLNPTDKTLQWELTLGKVVAQVRTRAGTEGKIVTNLVVKGVRDFVRPGFTRSDLRSAQAYATWRETQQQAILLRLGGSKHTLLNPGQYGYACWRGEQFEMGD